MILRANKQQAVTLQRTSRPKTPKPVNPTNSHSVNLNGSLRPENILQLQRTHGNKYVQRVLTKQRQPTVQRSFLGDLWDSVTETAGEMWDAAVEFMQQPIVGGEYVITDDLAYLRDEPPKLKTNGGLLPEGRHVTVLDSHKKGKKMYVLVNEKLPEHLLPSASQQGWTLFSNMSLPSSAEKAPEETPESPTTTTTTTTDVGDIEVSLPETEKAHDTARRAEATDLAALSKDEINALNMAGKTDIVKKIDNAKRELAKLQGQLKDIKKDKSINKAEKSTKKADKKQEIADQKKVIADLYAGIGQSVKAKIDIAVELGRVGLTPEKWFNKLYPSATFLGITIGGNQKVYKRKGWGGVHGEMYERLKVAEEILVTETGLTAEEIGKEMGLKRIGGLRHPKPATGSGTGVGLHSYGLAIDIGTKSGPNPYLGLHKTNDSAPVVKRATQLINGGAFDIRADAPRGEGKKRADKRVDQAGKMYDLLADASHATKIYFQFRDAEQVTLPDGQLLELSSLASAYSSATGEDLLTVAEWQEQIKADYDTITGKDTDFGKKMDPAKGFIGLDKRLVIAMTRAGISWGGLLPGAKDIMHFDYRGGTIKRGPVARL